MRRKKRARKSGSDYAVGYGRPPRSTQFKPGKSGNPRGRPEGAKNSASMAKLALERKLSFQESGVRRQMTVREVAYRRLAEKAVSGDIRALDFLESLENEKHSPSGEPPAAPASAEQDLEIIRAFLADRESEEE